MIHTDSERVQCVECKGSFKVSSIEGHVQRVHRGVKNASCPECGKKIRVESLLSHIKIVHSTMYSFLYELAHLLPQRK